MAKSSDKRPVIKLRSTEGTGYTYVTKKNKTNTRERIELKNYDPVLRRHRVSSAALATGMAVPKPRHPRRRRGRPRS